ncbi:TIR domain-containing protein [Kriegella aquimaris]|uniref:TIR domain-containing protein n=1 Tax=Kriegella aquimaris TaxID=192904 RepID=A0A1G9NAI9_9FLAO|nr:TIR domain-containing protein [Kriegella aquimaris]SDL83403.1 Protein of unknown function [Kriegella aquimaris]
MRRKRNIFAIYAGQNNEQLLYLLLYLKQLEDEFNVAIWHDDPIYPEQQWKPKNASRFNRADIFLLLVSEAFLHSEFIKQDEFKLVINRYRRGKAIVIPVLLDDCKWDIDFEFDDHNFNIKELKVLPNEGKPITDWNSADQVFMQVVDHLKEVMASFTENHEQMKSKDKIKKKMAVSNRKEQIEINFFEENKINAITEEDKRLKEEAEAKKKLQKENKRMEEAKAIRIAQEERRLQEEIEAEKGVEKEIIQEEEKKLKEKAEVERIVQEEKRLKEEAEANKRVEEANRLEEEKRLKAETEVKRKAELDEIVRQEAEAKKVIDEENRIREATEAARIVQEEKRLKEGAEAKEVSIEEKWENEEVKSEKGYEQEKRRSEDVATQKRVIRRNRLTGYNYRFKTGKVVEAKEATIEEKWENEEAKAQMTVKSKRDVEITKSESETILEERGGEDVAEQIRILKKNRLTGYNYRFKTGKVVEAKEVTIEEKGGNEEAKAQIAIKSKREVEIKKSEGETKLGKRGGVDVTEQIRILKKNRLTGYNYRFKTGKVVEAKEATIEEKGGNEDVKAQMAVAPKSGVEITKPESEAKLKKSEAKLKKRLGEVVAMLKSVMKKNRLALEHYYQSIIGKLFKAKEATIEEKEDNEEAKAQMAVAPKSGVEIAKPESEAILKQRLGDVVAMLKRVMKKNRLALGHYYQSIIEKLFKAKEATIEEKEENENAKAQMSVAPKSRVETTKPESVAKLKKRLGEVVAMLKRVIKKNRLALEHYYQSIIEKLFRAKEATIEEKEENEEAKAQMAVASKSGVGTTKSESVAKLKKRLGDVVAMLKRVMKKNRLALGHYYQSIIKKVVKAKEATIKEKGWGENRRMRNGFFIAAFIIGGLMIYMFTGGSEKKSTNLPEIEQTGVDSEIVTETTIDAAEQGESFSKLAIGDTYGGGIIFIIDQSGKTGKIAYSKDAGPMSWEKAMNIHEQLGEGWRLPTLDELGAMYRTIGQGATNSGQFADKLYWSATAYDTNQARLLRFSDGNTSYHYNKKVAHRKFQVRAVRDFRL